MGEHISSWPSAASAPDPLQSDGGDGPVQRFARTLLVLVLLSVWRLPGAHHAQASPPPLRIGAVFPLIGQMAPLARQEYRGVRIARDLINKTGGVGGRRIVLVTRELDQPGQAASVMRALH